MTDAFIETFLTNFDDSRYPAPFLERYEMRECLGHKEHGETFLVKDRLSGQYCVAKCYLKDIPGCQTPESGLLLNFDHKGLPVFISEFENDDIYVLVRSYIPGVPLNEFTSCFQPNKELFLSIGKQICDILVYLHQQNPPIIHRDIKPQNIIIDRQGKVTLIDFGISRVYNDASRTDTTFLGTRDFAAPEQYGFSQSDPRTDIYSLGVLMAWLLTGESDLEKAKKQLPDDRLKKTIVKCTAFDPKSRYQSAQQVKNALSGRELVRKLSIATAVFVVLLFCALYVQKLPFFSHGTAERVVFQEPMIEQAVRLTLGKESDELISQDDLLGIEALRIFGNQVALDETAIQHYTDLFVNNDSSIRRGDIQQLDDLILMKNLRNVTLIYQNITDINALAQLPHLETVDLRHNPIEDVTSLAGAAELSTLGLFDTNVTDLTALRDCERLNNLDLGSTLVQSFAALEGLDSLQFLCIRRTPLQSLEGITEHPTLKEIYLSETHVNDFSLLLELPRLEVVHVGEDDRNGIEELVPGYTFTVIYE